MNDFGLFFVFVLYLSCAGEAERAEPKIGSRGDKSKYYKNNWSENHSKQTLITFSKLKIMLDTGREKT